MNNAPQKVITVTQLNEYIKSRLEGDIVLSDLWLKGEISNFKNHSSGHYYFTLKDDGGVIRAVMFRSYAEKVPFRCDNGMKVLIRGRIGVFTRDGQYQIYCSEMQPDGVGSLYIAFEQLKAKLSEIGLFDEGKKLPLPKTPFRIGVITSPTGAAVRDIINILGRRFPRAEVTLFPALVQGASAAPSLISGIEYFNSSRSADVIIIGRGGGSIEDLWAFNDEKLVMAISESAIPIISAVGHETDFTLCDFVADRRAPTPSAAAELAVPEQDELRRKLLNVITHLQLKLSAMLSAKRRELSLVSDSRVLKSPQAFIDEKRMLLASYEMRLSDKASILFNNKRSALSRCAAKLDALSPLSVMSRGYSAVYKNGAILASAKSLAPGDNISIKFSEGQANAKITEII